MAYQQVVLIVLDGFGISNEKYGNPILETEKPTFDFIEKKYPFTTLQASSVAVGLPWGESGNSEVGHLTIGAGRVVYNYLPRIMFAIQDKSFFSNEALLGAVEHVRTNASRLHIAGLVSSGSVHSYIDHLYALLDLVKNYDVPEVFLHIFSDGKDAPPNEGGKFLASLEDRLLKMYPSVKIASIVGRTYAMDRDERWERVKKAYRLWVDGEGEPIVQASTYLRDSYKKEIYDSAIEPAFVHGGDGKPIGVISNNDAVIFLNFREDSMRETTTAFVQETFDYFPRTHLQNLYVVTMTEYSKKLATHIAFSPIPINYPLARVLSDAGFRQYHLAETEKYAHVTYFFNGGKEIRYLGEEWELIPSQAVAHYDERPEMRAKDLADHVLMNLSLNHFILVNFANADMIGHTGNYEALKTAIATLDREIGRIAQAVLTAGSILIITGDHGNAEYKINRFTGEILTEHTTNPVPFYLIGNDFERRTDRTKEEILAQRSEIGGILTDVSPTILNLLGIEKPHEMSGKSLLSFLGKQVV